MYLTNSQAFRYICVCKSSAFSRHLSSQWYGKIISARFVRPTNSRENERSVITISPWLMRFDNDNRKYHWMWLEIVDEWNYSFIESQSQFRFQITIIAFENIPTTQASCLAALVNGNKLTFFLSTYSSSIRVCNQGKRHVWHISYNVLGPIATPANRKR